MVDEETLRRAAIKLVSLIKDSDGAGIGSDKEMAYSYLKQCATLSAGIEREECAKIADQLSTKEFDAGLDMSYDKRDGISRAAMQISHSIRRRKTQ